MHLAAGSSHGLHRWCPQPSPDRASMARHVDADEILKITCAAMAHYEREFVVPCPFGKYDQVFVPEFNFGAMENPGVVTFREDAYLYPCRAARPVPAAVRRAGPGPVHQSISGGGPDARARAVPADRPGDRAGGRRDARRPDLPTGLRRVVLERRDDVQVALACQEVSRTAG